MNSNVDLILFGARGDLSKRKLFPALYQLDRAGMLEDSMRIAGLARQEVTTEGGLDVIKNEKVTPKGIPASRKPKKRGIDEHEQNGVTAPKSEA